MINKNEVPNFEPNPFDINNYAKWGLKKQERKALNKTLSELVEAGDYRRAIDLLNELDKNAQGFQPPLIQEGESDKDRLIEGKPELLPEKIPIMIHRWFPEGDGWAYNSSLPLADILMQNKNLNRVLTHGNRDGERGKVELENNNWAVYVMRPDSTTKDLKAKNRSPFYLTVAVVSGGEPTEGVLEEMYRQIENLPEVEEPGSHEDLIIGGI